jgi:hypothetical protein
MSVAAVQKHPVTPALRDDPRWDEAVDEHRAALAAFLEVAEGLREEVWSAPWAPGKWTRAQVAEHLSLAYAAAVREINTGETIRVRVAPGVRQTLLRWILLPHMLFHRVLPVRVKAPRVAWPGEVSDPRAKVLRRLREWGERYESAIERARQDGGGYLTHPYFGKLPPVKAMRFMAVHIEHHTRQIAAPK